MTNNLMLGADGQANHTVQVLRQGKSAGPLTTDIEFLPSFAFHADPALQITGQYRSPKGRLLELEVEVQPRDNSWVGLHLTLPARDLTHAGIVGFGARIAAPGIHVVRACIRSGLENSFVDCFFDKHLLFRAEEASHIDAISIHHRADLPIEASWRELILFLPPENFHISLIDLRLFIV